MECPECENMRYTANGIDNMDQLRRWLKIVSAHTQVIGYEIKHRQSIPRCLCPDRAKCTRFGDATICKILSPWDRGMCHVVVNNPFITEGKYDVYGNRFESFEKYQQEVRYDSVGIIGRKEFWIVHEDYGSVNYTVYRD